VRAAVAVPLEIEWRRWGLDGGEPPARGWLDAAERTG